MKYTEISIKPELVGVKGVASLLNISETSVRRLDLSGRIPQAIRIGKSKKWRLLELKEWINESCPSRLKWDKMKNC